MSENNDELKSNNEFVDVKSTKERKRKVSATVPDTSGINMANSDEAARSGYMLNEHLDLDEDPRRRSGRDRRPAAKAADAGMTASWPPLAARDASRDTYVERSGPSRGSSPISGNGHRDVSRIFDQVKAMGQSGGITSTSSAVAAPRDARSLASRASASTISLNLGDARSVIPLRVLGQTGPTSVVPMSVGSLEEEPKNVADVSIAATIGPVIANRATRADSSVPDPRSNFANRSSRTDINAAPRRKVVANFDTCADDFAAVSHPTEDRPPPQPPLILRAPTAMLGLSIHSIVSRPMPVGGSPLLPHMAY